MRDKRGMAGIVGGMKYDLAFFFGKTDFGHGTAGAHCNGFRRVDCGYPGAC